jgi:hypothetical protein
MHARRSDVIPKREAVLDLKSLPEAAVPPRDEQAQAPKLPRAPSRRLNARWPAAALVAALALNGLWVALLFWLLGRWIGVI